VIVLSEIAEKKGNVKLSEALFEWLGELLDGTGMNTVTIEGAAPDLPRQCEWAPAVEIAWNPDVFCRSPEVYIRWAGLRQRVEVRSSASSKREQASAACTHIEHHPQYSRIDIDHVEVSVNMETISIPWELKNGSSIDDDQPQLPKWPVTVRLCKSFGTGARPDHDGTIIDEAVILTSTIEESIIAISATQAFTYAFEHVDAFGPTNAFRVAAQRFSAVLWSRRKITSDFHSLALKTIHGSTIYDLPRVIHQARRVCSKESFWRQTVLFFDPNLPEFKFSISSDNDQDREMYLDFQITNESLR
jgi:hypothetical protein